MLAKVINFVLLYTHEKVYGPYEKQMQQDGQASFGEGPPYSHEVD